MNSDKDTRQTRLEARRNLIIESARISFQQQGLRGASIADIARRCQLGAGQIYRCFRNKEEIVEEIVQRIVFRRVGIMLEISHDLPRMAEALSASKSVFSPQDDDDDALLLEINAEAVYNPHIAEILLHAHSQLQQEGCRLMKLHFPWMEPQRLKAVSELMASLHEGAVFRRAIRQARNDNANNLKQLYLQLLEWIFAPPEENEENNDDVQHA